MKDEMLNMNPNEFINGFNKLKHQQNQLEKHELDILKFLTTQIDSKTDEEYNEIKIQREKEFHNIKEEVINVLRMLKNIKVLISKDNIEDTDTAVLKDNMMSFQIKLISIKSRLKSALEELQINEYTLQDDVKVTEERLKDMRLQMTNLKKNASKTNLRQKSSPFLQEVQDFANYVNKYGGHDGGWNSEDHTVFLKILKKTNDPDKIIAATQRVMPDISETEIKDHLDWYKKYLNLKEKQRKAIQEWKESKPTRIIKIEEKKEDYHKSTKKDFQRKNIDVVQMKEKLAQWKMQKQLKCQKSLESASKQSYRRKKLQLEQKEIRKNVKKEIQKWREAINAKQEHEQIEKELMSLREKEQRAAVANKLIKEFQNQDQHFINRRLANIKPETPKTEHIEKSSVKVPRDPGRLLKATKQWEARMARDDFHENSKHFAEPFSLKQIPKLGIPDWRKSVM